VTLFSADSQPRLRRTLTVVLVAYWLTLFVLTHLPPERALSTGIGDKVMHMLAYALLAALVQAYLRMRHRKPSSSGMTALSVCMIYGIIDEVTQRFVGREAELMDWMADTSGAATAVVVMTYFIRAVTR
jgi:VanZ family protein